MALRNIQKTFFQDFSQGVMLYSDSAFIPVNLNPGQLLLCQNAYERGGLQKRKGMSKLTSNVISVAAPVKVLHRFYRNNQAAQLLAACGDKIVRYDENSKNWIDIKTDFSTEENVFFTGYGPTEKVFIANNTGTPQVWDGAVMTDYSAAPAGTKQFIVHRERVFSYSSGLDINYSDNLNPDTWSSSALTLASDDPAITAAITHTQNTADTSVVSQLLFFTDNTTWVLAGNDFVTLDDVYLQEISGQIGTSSPNSVVKTPRGVVFFGRQQGRNNVFIVLGEGLGARIVAVGDSIRQDLAEVPASALDEVAAIYFDGYYRLSVRPAGKISNTKEWWLKMDNISQGKIAWFGPMERSIGLRSIIALSGGNDNNKLYGGSENGYVYQLDNGFNDDGNDIEVKIQTGFHDFGFTSREKKIDAVYANIQASGGVANFYINADFSDTASEISKNLSLASSGGTFPYTFPFDFSRPVSSIKTLDFMQDRPKGIYMSVKVEFSETNEDFLLNTLGIRYQVDERDQKEDG